MLPAQSGTPLEGCAHLLHEFRKRLGGPVIDDVDRVVNVDQVGSRQEHRCGRVGQSMGDLTFVRVGFLTEPGEVEPAR